jgi:hypothetical protein
VEVIRVQSELDCAGVVARAGRGNLLIRVPTEQGDRVLKLYRRRRSVFNQALSSFSNALIEGKRSPGPRSRCETERQCLDLWARYGFDVFRRIDEPLPDGVELPGLWIEYCSGRTLKSLLLDAKLEWPVKRAAIRRLAGMLGRRHRKALDLDEILLVQEHSGAKHVFLSGDRMITFDLEGAFQPGFPLREALTQDLAGYLRSILRCASDRVEDALEAFVEGYRDPELLRELAHWGVHGRNLFRVLKRVLDRRRRPSFAKTDVLQMLLEHQASARPRAACEAGVPNGTRTRDEAA